MKQRAFFVIPGLLFALNVFAAVTVTSGPTSLITSPLTVRASSGQIGLFSFTLSQDAGETLSSVTVSLANAGSSAAIGSHLASVSVYRDDGNGTFDPAIDLLAGSQASVNIGSDTVVATGANNGLDGAGTRFFVSLATSAAWSGAAPADSITATLPSSGLVTSANSPTVTAATTSTITADTTVPTLTSAVARNTGGTAAKEAGDSVVVTFSEATNKPVLTAGNIASTLALSGGHSFLDGAGALGGAAWNADGTVLTITLSAGTSAPTVEPGDTVTGVGTLIIDAAGNPATGVTTILGRFDGPASTSGEGACPSGLINGRLYQLTGDASTTYLAAACRLKVFKGKAVGHAKGQKFQNILTLGSLAGLTGESAPPPLPAAAPSLQALSRANVVRDLAAERRALKLYARLFRRLPRAAREWQVFNYLAYGGTATGRDLSAERRALAKFIRQFGHRPLTEEDWRVLHALAYGGEATR